MKKKRIRMDKLEKKLKIENLERCVNCELFCKCSLRKEEVVCCSKYREVDVDEQLVIVTLKEWDHLSHHSLCRYIPQK